MNICSCVYVVVYECTNPMRYVACDMDGIVGEATRGSLPDVPERYDEVSSFVGRMGNAPVICAPPDGPISRRLENERRPANVRARVNAAKTRDSIAADRADRSARNLLDNTASTLRK